LNTGNDPKPPNNIEYFLTALFDSMKRSGRKRPGLYDAAFLLTRYRIRWLDVLVETGLIRRWQTMLWSGNAPVFCVIDRRLYSRDAAVSLGGISRWVMPLDPASSPVRGRCAIWMSGISQSRRRICPALHPQKPAVACQRWPWGGVASIQHHPKNMR